MKYQAPVGVTAIFCAGEVITPDEDGRFEAAELLLGELAAHGCVFAAPSEAKLTEKSGEMRPRARTRAEKAN
ncbi:hypothetical protein [Rhodoblastus sp.]|uniref:hypothetical protein n=1 Tax=Rhodoblastus sp. TaxID=1962975 RepID=UPI003F94ADE0